MLEIDQFTGWVQINSATPVLKLDMPILDLGTLPVIEQLDMNNGWRHVVLDCGKPQPAAISSLALSFHHGRLKYVAVSMAIHGESPLVTHQRHTSYLKDKLTAPCTTSPSGISYNYPWGNIGAHYDPRNDSASIVVRWRDEIE